MKRYRTYTAKKFKVWKRVIFFAVVALIIFLLSMVLGNHLKKKVENADYDKTKVEETTAPIKDERPAKDDAPSVEHDEAYGKVKAGYLDLSGVKDSVEVSGAVSRLKGEGYDCFSFVLTDEDGNLTYASPAVEESSRLPSSEALVPISILSEAVKSAHGAGLRTSCVITASDSLSDDLVFSEIGEMGFDEIIVRGFEKYIEIDNDRVEEIRSYVNRIRTAAGGEIAVGVCFSADFYKAARNAPYIEKIYKFSNFLSIDMTGANEAVASNVTADLAGSFSLYLLRPLISGSDTENASAVRAALENGGVLSAQYISAPLKSVDSDTSGD